MECRQCGGSMMQETVIKLRRGFLGFRETRFAGAYCLTCRVGVAADGAAPVKPQPASTALVLSIAKPRLPLWCRGDFPPPSFDCSRSGVVQAVR